MSKQRNMRKTVVFHVGVYALGTACLIADGLTGIAFTVAWLAILAGIAAGWIRTLVKADQES